MKQINDVSATALTTIRCHALDAESQNPILNNTLAGEVLKQLSGHIHDIPRPRKSLVTHIALRAKKYDEVVLSFISKYPEATVVNIGCGFDTRFQRVDNGKINYYDLDLPDVISVKESIVSASSRYKMLATSAFDGQWFKAFPSGPILLLAEGVFMYCEEEEVKKLLLELGEHFGAYEFFFEVFNRKWMQGWRGRMVSAKLQRQLRFGKDASFRFGIADSREPESWSPHLKLLEEWSYLDTNHPRLGPLRLFRKLESMRKLQWSVRFRYR